MHSFTFARRYRGKLQAVVLDWAGTTVDFGCCAPAGVFIEIFRRRQVEITTDEARAPMGAHKKVHIRAISRMPDVAQRWQAAHGRPCTEQDVEAMFNDFVPLQIGKLAKHADLVPGTLEAIAAMRDRGLKIATSTGYTAEIMEPLIAEAKRRGYDPDSTVCASDVPAGRPEPWMCLVSAQRLRAYPLEAMVKIGDTLPDITAGLNAGMWTIGVARTGNEMGLTEEQLAALPVDQYQQRIERAYARMVQAGAHYVVDGIGDTLPCLDNIARRLADGEKP